MDEALKTTAALSTNIDTFLAFVILVVPGFISLRAFEAKRGGEPQKLKDVIVDVVIFSFVTDVIVVPAIIAELSIRISWILNLALLTTIVVAMPVKAVGLGVGYYSLQKRFARAGVVHDPVQKPWDKLFEEVRDRKLDLGLIVTLHDGRRIGGRYVAR